MDDAKVFEAKNLDEAIRLACTFFDAPREKLEVEFIQDAKSGIFGLVGARKAMIRARRAALGPVLGSDTPQAATNPPAKKHKPAENQPVATPKGESEHTGGRSRAEKKPAQPASEAVPATHIQHNKRPVAPKRQPVAQTQRDLEADAPALVSERAETAVARCEDFDQERLRQLVYDTAMRLITPITGPMQLVVDIHADRVDVRVDCEDDLGLLIGRDGQNLASLQYLTSRIVSRAMEAPVRVMITAGDYRERQDEKLRDLALSLAERAKATGRACPTKPLSSYQRRVIHMTLQADPAVQTRSAGEGTLKRVVVQKRRQPQENRQD